MKERGNRKKTITKGERTFLAVVSTLGIVALAVFVCFFIVDVARKHDLQNSGVHVLGIVDAKDIHYVHAKTGTFTRRTIDYHFQTIETDEWVSREDVPVTNGEFEKLSEGSGIELRYDAGDPSANAPVSALKHISPTYSMILILAGVFGGVAAYSYVMKKFGKRFYDAKSKNRWVGFFKFLVQMLFVFIFIFAGGSLAGAFVRGLNSVLFGT